MSENCASTTYEKSLTALDESRTSRLSVVVQDMLKQARLTTDALDYNGDRATALWARGLSIGDEARKLVERHGLYLLATL